MAEVAAADTPFWEAWRLHDYFNLAILPLLVGGTFAALRHKPYNFPLALFMFVYIAIDGLWIAVQPHIVGSPNTLLGHHVATLLVVLHALTCQAHVQFVSWMTIVEVNTFFLVLKRHVHHPIIPLLFKASWAAIRVVWFPVVAVYFTFFLNGTWGAGWFNAVRRVAVSSCVSGLALLQLQWTWTAMIAPMLKPKAPAEEQTPTSASGADGKKGFL